ncbi:MAG: glucose-6-phosphate isomerase [Rikenellaceae bacterium]|jgi:glucose-6-phosphate isomerase|nr:glucose-6-phosphate isomerase [Rikenellaceae bacterium]
MEKITLDYSKAALGAKTSDIAALSGAAKAANELLENGRGAGSDFLGWVDLPASITPAQLSEIKAAAEVLRERAEVVVVVGIGGSYLGAKAVLEALSDSFAVLHKTRKDPVVVFAGQNLSEDYTWELLEALKEYSFGVVVISKSGTTTEPAVAFRILKAEVEKRYGKAEAAKRIIAVTDAARGALKSLSMGHGYRSFVIPDNVGGRFSVLTPVGLLPLAVAGVDVDEFVRGAADMQAATAASVPFADNIAEQYATARNFVYRKGFNIEILASYEPKLQYIAEWWKQLYGESEGKDGKGIFPASVTLTADLHSMGQYIQDGERHLFETVVSVHRTAHKFSIEADEQNLDGLNFLAGKRIGQVNRMAELGTMLAHVDGGVPNLKITLPEINAYWIGALLYFFERACGVSGYMLGVNPFDQPGVEAYKKNMFALLDKPGFEKEGEELRKRL